MKLQYERTDPGQRDPGQRPRSDPGHGQGLTPVTVMGTPKNQMIRDSSFRFTVGEELFGFNPGNSDKLVVALSHERGRIANVTYGGVAMVPAVSAGSTDSQSTSIFYLDDPGESGDLVVVFNGNANGVGGALFALSNIAPGAPVATDSAKTRSLKITTPVSNCFLIASHACNDNTEDSVIGTKPPLTTVFAGPTGSSAGSFGFRQAANAGVVELGFSGDFAKPVTAVAAFAPIP